MSSVGFCRRFFHALRHLVPLRLRCYCTPHKCGNRLSRALSGLLRRFERFGCKDTAFASVCSCGVLRGLRDLIPNELGDATTRSAAQSCNSIAFNIHHLLCSEFNAAFITKIGKYTYRLVKIKCVIVQIGICSMNEALICKVIDLITYYAFSVICLNISPTLVNPSLVTFLK